jgi:solute carrier family 25 thiamine pyrophosphate transporter 19
MTSNENTSLSNTKPKQIDNWISWNSLNIGAYATYIGAASLVSGVISYPFYVLTTRQQAGVHMTGDISLQHGTGLKDAIHKIGWKGLFRGVIFSNFFYVPSSILYLSITEYTRHKINSFFNLHRPDWPVEYVESIQVVTSGFFANFVSILISNPTNVILAKLVIQQPTKPLNYIGITKQIYQNHKLKGFGHGFTSNLIFGTLSSGVWWGIYSGSRRISFGYIDMFQNNVAYVDAFCGFIAGGCATVALHPLDTLTAKIMTGATKDVSIFGALKEVSRHSDGLKSLWKGLVPSLAGTALGSTIFAMAYEFIKRSSIIDSDENK